MKSAKRYVVVGVVAVSFLTGASFVSAQQISTEVLMAQINNLLLLVQDLQVQLTALKTESAAQLPAALTTSTPVAILSQNKGESYIQGQPIEVSWRGGAEKVQVGLVDKKYETDNTILGWIALGEKPNSSLVWSGENIFDITGTVSKTIASLSSGPYKIIAVSAGVTKKYCVLQNSDCNYDVSDSYLTVIPSVSLDSSDTPITSCAPTVATVQTGAMVSWEVAPASNGQPPFVYSWSGTDGIATLPTRSLSGGRLLEVIYNTIGLKMAGVTVRDAVGRESFVSCNTPVFITPAPAPLTILSPNGGESFVLTKTLDPSQFVRISWRSEGLRTLKEGKIQIALQDIWGRDCNVSIAPSNNNEKLIALVDGYECPNNNWALSPGQYKVKVYLEGKEAMTFDTSDSYITLTEPVDAIQAIIPSVSSINSGESVKFRFLFPPNTFKASLYLFCPNGVSANTPSICNRYTDITSYLASSTEYTVAFLNSSGQAQTVASNYYVYLPNNPNHARGVSTKISVRPVSAASNNSITILSPNGGEQIQYGKPFLFRFTSKQAGLVDVSLVPYPPIDASLICQIATSTSASAGEFFLTIPATGLCVKGSAKIVAGRYTLFATLRILEMNIATDVSDSFFTITATSTVPQ